MPFVVAFLGVTLNHQPFTQVVQATGLHGSITIRFDKARPVLNQVITVQLQTVGAVDQCPLPVGQALTGLHRQTAGRRHHRRRAVVVDDAPVHGDVVAHQRSGIVQGIDVQRHAVSLKAPGILQCPCRQLQRFTHQDGLIGDAGRSERQIAWQQPVRQVGKGAAQGERHRTVTADGVAGLVGVVLLRGQRHRLQAQQGTVLVIQGARMRRQVSRTFHAPALVEQRQRRIGR